MTYYSLCTQAGTTYNNIMCYRPKVIAATAPPPRRQRTLCRCAGVFDFALPPVAFCDMPPSRLLHCVFTTPCPPQTTRRPVHREGFPTGIIISPVASRRGSYNNTYRSYYPRQSPKEGGLCVKILDASNLKTSFFCFSIRFTSQPCAAHRSAKLIGLSAFTPVKRTRTAAGRSLNLYQDRERLRSRRRRWLPRTCHGNEG